jgi:flagellar protein FlaH
MHSNVKSIILERKGEKDGFAERLGVYIPDGSIIFIEGEEGTGKSIFCQRFCISYLKNGISCSYISTQFTIKSFLKQTASVGYNTKQYLMAGKLFLISTEVTLAETLPKNTFLENFLTCRRLFDPEIIFIDSISTLLNESLNKNNLTDLTNFFNRLAGTGKIIYLTANPNEWDDYLNLAFKIKSDIHYKITRETIPGIGIVHNFYIEKFNGAIKNYEPRTTFSVRPGVGLTIESSGVAF